MLVEDGFKVFQKRLKHYINFDFIGNKKLVERFQNKLATIIGK